MSRRLRARGPAEEARLPAVAQRGNGLIEAARPADLDGDVDAAPASPRAGRLTPGRVRLVVEDMIGAELHRSCALLRARRRQHHARPCGFCELKREERNATG